MGLLAFVEAAPIVLVGVLDVLIWAVFGKFVLLPWFDEQFGHQTPWWKHVATWPLRVIQRKVSKLIHRITSEMSHRFAMASPVMSRLLRRQAAHLEQLTGVVVASNQAALEAFVYIRHTLVPTLIERAVAPLRTALKLLTARVTKLETELANAGASIRATVRSLPWGVASADFNVALNAWLGSYRQLWHKVFTNLETRVSELERGLKRLGDQVTFMWSDLYRTGLNGIDGIRARLLTIEKAIQPILTDPTTWLFALLGAAMVPAISGAAFRLGLGNLFCRNTQTVAKQICAMDEVLLAELLAGTLLFGLIIDPKAVVAVGKEVEGAINFAFREMAGL